MMKHILISFFLFFVLIITSPALDSDWGGKVENISQLSNVKYEQFTQGNKAVLWYRGEQSDLFNVYAKGGYIYRYEKETHKYIPDISDVYVYGRSVLDDGKSLNYNVGRFRFNDSTTRVLKSVADGAELSFQNRTLPARFGVGYTGFVFNLTSEVVMTPADKLEQDDKFLLAPPRLVAFAEVKYPNLAGGNTITLAAIAQQDLRSEDNDYMEASASGKLHTQYFQLGADGRIVPDLYYNISGVLQTGQYLVPAYDPLDARDYSILGGMAAFSLDYYVETRYRTTISLDALYSSGDSWSDRADFGGSILPGDDQLNRYTPISNSTKGFVYAPQIGNLIFGDLSVSMKPVETVQVVLSGITFFRAVDGPIFDTALTEEAGDALYLGQEIDLVLNYRPLSDLGLALTSGIFLPNGDIQTEKDIQYRIGGYVSVSF